MSRVLILEHKTGLCKDRTLLFRATASCSVPGVMDKTLTTVFNIKGIFKNYILMFLYAWV